MKNQGISRFIPVKLIGIQNPPAPKTTGAFGAGKFGRIVIRINKMRVTGHKRRRWGWFLPTWKQRGFKSEQAFQDWILSDPVLTARALKGSS